MIYDRAGKRYKLPADCFVPPISFTEQECLAMMFLARKVLSAGLWPDSKAAAQVMLKLENVLPAHLRERCEDVLAKLDLNLPPFSLLEGHLDIFSQLQRALLCQSKVRIVYEPLSNARFEDCLHPYHLAFVRHGWYVFGYSETTEAVDAFRIERILDCEPLHECFDMDQPFTLSEYYGNAWQMARADEQFHVILKFTPEAADSIEELTWHKTQETWRTKSDSLIFEADVDGIEEISSWVLGHGEGVKVVHPPELGELVGTKAKRVSQMYDSSDKAGS